MIHTPLHPTFIYSKIGVYRGMYDYLIFALKHRLWVLVSEAVLTLPTIYVFSKNKKNITIFHLKVIIFMAVKSHGILHGCVFVMELLLMDTYILHSYVKTSRILCNAGPVSTVGSTSLLVFGSSQVQFQV